MANITRDRLIAMLKSAVGIKAGEYLDNPKVIELMLNDDRELWIDILGEGMKFTGICLSPENATQIISLVASSTGTICNALNPRLSAEFPGTGDRFEGCLPPIVQNPVFTLRKKAIQVFTLEDYINQEIMTPTQAENVKNAVKSRQNILIVGGTGSGKTTFANAVLREIAETQDRVVIIQDTNELQYPSQNRVFLRTSDNVTMNDLLKSTMRLRPDRIIVGEVRGGEALSLLKAWNTGHPGGCATVHANSAYGGLIRLEQLIQEAIENPPRELIAEAVNLIIYMERTANGRKIKEISKVTGMDKDKEYLLEAI